MLKTLYIFTTIFDAMLLQGCLNLELEAKGRNVFVVLIDLK